MGEKMNTIDNQFLFECQYSVLGVVIDCQLLVFRRSASIDSVV